VSRKRVLLRRAPCHIWHYKQHTKNPIDTTLGVVLLQMQQAPRIAFGMEE
jgi:hypothetical protein